MSEPSPGLIWLVNVIDKFTDTTGGWVSWLSVPLVLAVSYEVISRYFFDAPTIWSFDVTFMLYGTIFMLGAAYALSKGVHIRSDFLYRDWSVRRQATTDALLYVVFYFPSMMIFLWVASEYAYTAVVRWERGMDSAWMPYLGPVRSTMPIGIAFLVLQGISELLRCFYAMRTGRWPQQ